MIIECDNESEWLSVLNRRYDKNKVKFNDSDKGTTVLFYPSYPNQAGQLIVGRYNKVKGTGVVFCRREKDVPVLFNRRKK